MAATRPLYRVDYRPALPADIHGGNSGRRGETGATVDDPESTEPAGSGVGHDWRRELSELMSEPPDWLGPILGTQTIETWGLAPHPTLVIGFGGSCLGLSAVMSVVDACGIASAPLRMLDSLDAERVRDAFEWAKAQSAHIIVISKSGTTAEVMALLEHALAIGLRPRAIISAPGDNPLRRRIEGLEVRDIHISTRTGGRYSVFGSVAAVPMQAIGLDHREMAVAARDELEGMTRADTNCQIDDLDCALNWRLRHPAACQVVWCYAESLLAWAHWLAQLDCESLSRTLDDGANYGEFMGVLRGPADQHSVAQHLIEGPRDKRVTIVDFTGPSPSPGSPTAKAIDDLRRIERDATFESLPHACRRVLLDRERGLASLAVLMLHNLLETVMWAKFRGFSPYGQPGVEAIKSRVRAALASRG